MTKYFIARTHKGQEFILDRSLMIAVPTSTRQKICDSLNEMSYKLKEDQRWHVYENDWYYNDYISQEIKRYEKVMKVRSYYG